MTQTRRLHAIHTIAIVGVGALVTLAAGACDRCGRNEATPVGAESRAGNGARRPLLIYAWDGAAPVVIEEMLARGRLPALAGLIERGVYARLTTITPTLSPAIWTSVATGKAPGEHGVRSFWTRTEDGGRARLFDATDRRAAALWNIASLRGFSVDVIGWWMTWPTEPILGTMVSDRFVFNRSLETAKAYRVDVVSGERDRDAARTDRAVSPDDARAQLHDCIVAPDALGLAFIRVMARHATAPASADAVGLLRGFFAQDATYQCIAERLLRRRQPALFMLFNHGTDVIGHAAWRYVEPDLWRERFGGEEDPQRAAFFRSAIEETYRLQDARLGHLLQLVDPRTNVIVLSDHGMTVIDKRNPMRPLVTGAHNHAPPGIVVVAGPSIRSGASLDRPHVYDVAPTALRLLDLPIADDMIGRVWSEALDSPAPAPPTVPTYPYQPPSIPPLPSELRDPSGLGERLEALGYTR